MIVALVRDLLMASRIEEAARGAGVPFLRVDALDELPAANEVALLVVDWSERQHGWGERLGAWRNGREPEILVFGQHTDLEAHAEARRVGLGPMWARSKLVATLPGLAATAATHSSPGDAVATFRASPPT